MKILVMGAGAVGIYYGARLQEAGEEVIFCARGANLRALRERGLELESPRGNLAMRVVATDDPRQFASYDLVLFCVKFHDTDTAARQLGGCLAPDGAVLTLQNGVECEARLCEHFGREAVMGGNGRVGADLVAPGKVVHLSAGFIDFGELNGRETARALRIAEAFRRAGIMGAIASDLATLRWSKLIWNAAFNTVTTLSQRRVGEVLDDPDGARLLTRLMEETRGLAIAEGAKLGPENIEAQLERSRKNLRALKTSTQQDFERGKPLEYEALSGAVIRAARRHRLEVPATETVYALLKLLDGRLGRAS